VKTRDEEDPNGARDASSSFCMFLSWLAAFCDSNRYPQSFHFAAVNCFSQQAFVVAFSAFAFSVFFLVLRLMAWHVRCTVHPEGKKIFR